MSRDFLKSVRIAYGSINPGSLDFEKIIYLGILGRINRKMLRNQVQLQSQAGDCIWRSVHSDKPNRF